MTKINPDEWSELGPLLDRALELTGEQRIEWLDQLRRDDPDAAARLTELLSAESEANKKGFLSEAPAVSLAGHELGNYTLVRPLGYGGMGSVWLARRTDGRFEGFAAVKLMNLALMSDTGQARFRREGTALARLTHPGIARLLDAGVAPSGQPYLVLEYVDGQRIDAYVSSAALTHQQTVSLVLQVLDAVGHAHANLIVHRDLKPSNILVTAHGQVKLLDFGIAKLLHADGDGVGTAVTGDGGSALTPDYASPEQVKGEDITTATDVYALGVLLYLLLSGRHPTKGDKTTPAETVRSVLDVEPQPLGLGDLDTIVAKALRKVPIERYSTVAGFADDLRRYLRHEPVSAQPDSLGYRVMKFVRRNRTAVVVAAGVSCLLLASTAYSIAQARRAEEQRDLAVRSSRRALALSELQTVVASDSRDVDGEPLTMKRRLEIAEKLLVNRFRGEPWLVAEVLTDLALRLSETLDQAASREMLARAAAIARTSNLPELQALTACERASLFWFDDMLDSMRAEMAVARTALARSELAKDAILNASCLEAAGKEYQANNQPDSAVLSLQRAVQLVESDRGSNMQLTKMTALSEMLRFANRHREAVAVQQRVLREMLLAGYGGTEMMPNLLSFLTTSLSDLGEFRVADSIQRAIIREMEVAVDTAPIPTLLAFMHGMNKLALDDIDSADVWIARAAQRPWADGTIMANRSPSVLALLRLRQGRVSDARAAAAKLPGGRPGRRATAALVRAMIQRASGDSAGAAQLLEGELAKLYSESPKTQSLYAMPLVTAGMWRLERGDPRGADSLAQLAWRAAVTDSLAASRSGLAGRSDLLRAHAHRALGDPAAARAAAISAVTALSNGYGKANQWTLIAQALRDSLAR